MKKVRLKLHKIIIKQRLADKVVSFSEEELQKIIDDEFFTDGIEMDIEIIDMAARRMAALTGNSECEQIEKIAHAALRRALKNSIKKGVVSLKRGNSFWVQKKHSDYENPNACGRM